MRFSGSGDHCKKLTDAEVGGEVVSAIGASSKEAAAGSTGGAFVVFAALVAGEGTIRVGFAVTRRSRGGGEGAMRSGSGVLTKGERCTGFARSSVTADFPGTSWKEGDGRGGEGIMETVAPPEGDVAEITTSVGCRD